MPDFDPAVKHVTFDVAVIVYILFLHHRCREDEERGLIMLV